jgi:hypothetical protein
MKNPCAAQPGSTFFLQPVGRMFLLGVIYSKIAGFSCKNIDIKK